MVRADLRRLQLGARAYLVRAVSAHDSGVAASRSIHTIAVVGAIVRAHTCVGGVENMGFPLMNRTNDVQWSVHLQLGGESMCRVIGGYARSEQS